MTLVEPKARYTTCFSSALDLAGNLSLELLTHGYETLSQRYGIKIVHDFATAIDPVAKTVNLKSGGKLPYDRLVVLAPGIAFKFDAIEGYDEAATEIMPHAWIAGPQTELLRRQLTAWRMGVFLIASPPNPFRCPPGPMTSALRSSRIISSSSSRARRS